MTISTNTLQLDRLSKHFGSHIVLDNITAHFYSGKIYGIVGQNGCGKTVLLKCLCGLIPVDCGTVALSMDKENINKKGKFGVIIEAPGFLPHFSGYENLRMLARLSRDVSKNDIQSVLAITGLTDVARKKVSKYSLGMRQRLGIAQAIMGKPQVLLLDEPLNGLDQSGVERTYALLQHMRDCGVIIILASHHKQDIDLLCDDVYEIKNGQLFCVKSKNDGRLSEFKRMGEI